MIDVEVETGIAVVRMDHGKVNAMDLDFCRSLTHELNQVASNENVEAAILIGNERVFSAGVDLVTLLRGGEEYLNEFLPALIDCFKTLFKFPKPMVAAINGHAVAGGCILATACDQRLIHAKAKIGIPELRVGVPLPSIAIEIMRFGVAQEALRSMVNIGKTYRGEEAIRVGLADRVVDRDQMLESAFETAQELMSIPLSVFELSKRQLRAPAMRMVAENESEFEASLIELWHTAEIREVIRLYVAKHL